MRTLLQLLFDYLWPVRPQRSGKPFDANAVLRPLLVLVIALLCGPEVFLAADLVLLVDLFGVVMFLTVFAVGYRMFAITALGWIKRVLFPPEWADLVKSRGYPSLMAHGVLLTGVNAVRVCTFTVVALLGIIGVAFATI